MTKEELEKEATEYAQKLGAKDFIAKPKEIVAYFGYLAGAEPREKRIAELEKENAELKSENQKWKDEWQEQVQKATDEGYARTLQTIQLSKAKDIIREFVEWATWQGSNCPNFKSIQDKAEQFLKEEPQSKWVNPARTTNDNQIKLSEVEK